MSVTQETAILDAKTDDSKAPGAFKTISEVADILDVPQHVLRFWESKFPQIKPLKMRGGRRYYRPEDIAALVSIKELLYKEGYTIDGAKKAFGQTKPEAPAAQMTPPKAPKEKSALTDKQRAQIAFIRDELAAMREILKPHLS